MLTRRLTLATVGCLMLWTVMSRAGPVRKEHALRVGKKGEITLTQPTKVGELMLQPDTYVVQHRVDKDGNHFVRFVELKQVKVHGHRPYTYNEEDKAGEVKCRVEPAAGPIKETTIFTATDGGAVWITKAAVKGEDVVHVF